MYDSATLITGVVFLLVTGLAFFKLAPREGAKSIGWMERENVAMTVILVLFVLGVFGVGLVIKALI